VQFFEDLLLCSKAAVNGKAGLCAWLVEHAVFVVVDSAQIDNFVYAPENVVACCWRAERQAESCSVCRALFSVHARVEARASSCLTADSSCIFRRSEQRETPPGRWTPRRLSVRRPANRLVAPRSPCRPGYRSMCDEPPVAPSRRRRGDARGLGVVEGIEGRRRHLCDAGVSAEPMTPAEDSRAADRRVEPLPRQLMSAALVCVLMTSALARAEFDGMSTTSSGAPVHVCHYSTTTRPNAITFSVHVACGRTSILLWWCTSGFVDDVMSPYNGPFVGMLMPLQRRCCSVVVSRLTPLLLDKFSERETISLERHEKMPIVDY